MRTASHTFLRALSVGLIGLLAFFLLAFFAVMFFAKSSMHQAGNGMMDTLDWERGTMVSQSAPMMFGKADGMREDVWRGENTMMVNIEANAESVSERKLAKNGNLDLQVGSVDETLVKIDGIAKEMGGMVSSSHFNRSATGTKSGSVEVRVEVGRFDEAFARLKEVAGVVVSEDVSGRDVTEQFIDLEARIRNKKAAEVTLQSLFDRAVKISDVMEVTDKLAVVRSEIELLEGQMRYLSSQTELATISLFLTEDVTVVADQSFRPTQTIKQSVMMLFSLLGSFIKGVIMLIILGVPILLAYGLVLWVLYRIVRGALVRYWPGILEEKRRLIRKK